MKIRIIGAGNIGSALALRFSERGHDVRIANSRGPATRADVARQTGAMAVDVRDAVKDADVIVVTIPQGKVPNLPKDLFATVPANTVVIDTGNYLSALARRAHRRNRKRRAGELLGRAADRPARCEGVQQYLRGASARSRQAGGRGGARGAAGRGRRSAGEECRDAPDRRDWRRSGRCLLDRRFSWRQQPATPVYTADLDAAGVHAALQKADPARKPENGVQPIKAPVTSTIPRQSGSCEEETRERATICKLSRWALP